MKRFLGILFAMVLVLAMAAEPAHTAWSNDPSINTPVCIADGDQRYPQVTSDGAGGDIFTWQDYRNGNWDIYAQRIDASGNALWMADGVPICNTTDNQTSPKIVSDGAGGAIITWRDKRGADDDIYTQRVDSAGNVMWMANGVPICTAARQQAVPELVSDDTGGAIITWDDIRTPGAGIYAQRVDASGNTLWTDNGVAICPMAHNVLFQRIVSDGLGGAIIIWRDLRNDKGDIYAQRMDALGNALWETDGIAVCTAPELQNRPRIAPDGSGGAIITWEDDRFGDDDIYAQRVDANGSLGHEHHTLTMMVVGSGTVTPPEGTHIYPVGTTINISAAPAVGWEFANWKGEVADMNAASTNITMNDDYLVIANFVESGSIIKIATEEATNITATIATLNGNLIDMGDADMVDISFTLKPYKHPMLCYNTQTTGAYAFKVDKLIPDTTYKFRATAHATSIPNTDYTVFFGEEKSFTTLPSTAPQLWYLDSETGVAAPNGYQMEKSGGPGDDGQTGSVNIGPDDNAIWLADQAALCDVTFPSGSWVVEIRTDSDWGVEGDKCEVSVGGWDTNTGWYDIPTITATTITWDAGFNILTVLLQTESGTIYIDDYLTLKIRNNDSGSHTVYTEGRSSLRSPDTDPGYPVPELATGILLGLGLVGLLGYLGLKKRKVTDISA